MPSEAEWAYCAGFIDGEGCFTLRRHKRKDGSYYSSQPFLIVMQKDRRPLDALHGIMGGRIYPFRKQGQEDCWQLHVGGKELQEALTHLIPHLILKREQAEALVELQLSLTS